MPGDADLQVGMALSDLRQERGVRLLVQNGLLGLAQVQLPQIHLSIMP
ncbi:MAG: hypothetical protein LBD51_07245 [Bifidobacteriaceae bacterium]|jgi:hypothetical protein|nr:hypothetical protein [Bifidobacteriaceae bacterium]